MESHYLFTFWKILWLLYRKCNGRRNCRSRKTRQEMTAVTQNSALRHVLQGKVNNAYNTTTSMQLSQARFLKISNSCLLHPNYPMSQVLPCLPPQRTLNSITSSTISNSTCLSLQPYHLCRTTPGASTLVS